VIEVFKNPLVVISAIVLVLAIGYQMWPQYESCDVDTKDGYSVNFDATVKTCFYKFGVNRYSYDVGVAQPCPFIIKLNRCPI
jgi:hypothetical protein